MYKLPQFVAGSEEAVFAFMQAHPFVVVMANGEKGIPAVSQVPVLIEQKKDKIFIEFHVMRGTSHAKALQQQMQAMCLFTGPHAYVSASWYTNKKVASTWNYQSVQASGTLQLLDETALHQHLTRLTEKFEAGHSGEALVQNMDPAYVHKMMQAIVGFSMEVQALEHVFKLSQNRTEKDFDTIIHKLSDIDGYAEQVAAAMKNCKTYAYPKQK